MVDVSHLMVGASMESIHRRPIAYGAVSVTAIGGMAPAPESKLHMQRGPMAEVRTKLRQAAPEGHWHAVMAEVTRLQNEASATPLQAYEAVLAKLAAGWLPSA